MATGFCSNIKEQIVTCDAKDRPSVDALNGYKQSSEPIVQLCEWNIPCGRFQIFHVNKRPSEGLTQSSCLKLTPISSLDEPLERLKPNEDHFENTGGNSQVKSVERHTGHENGEKVKQASQAGGTLKLNCHNGNVRPSSSETRHNGLNNNLSHLGRNRLTSIAPASSHEREERTSNCSVDGASFCLESLSMINHCTQFGGGPGIDRDGEQVSGKFCGVGARYRVGKHLQPIHLNLSLGTVDRALPGKKSNQGRSVAAIEEEISATTALAKSMIFCVVTQSLGNMVYALAFVKSVLLLRVPGLSEKITKTCVEFLGNVKELTESESLIENVSLFKKKKVKVLLEFDPNEFVGMLSLPDEEASTYLQNTLNEWNEELKHFLAIFLPNSERRVPKNQ